MAVAGARREPCTAAPSAPISAAPSARATAYTAATIKPLIGNRGKR